jgi:hypothetical protein
MRREITVSGAAPITRGQKPARDRGAAETAPETSRCQISHTTALTTSPLVETFLFSGCSAILGTRGKKVKLEKRVDTPSGTPLLVGANGFGYNKPSCSFPGEGAFEVSPQLPAGVTVGNVPFEGERQWK